MQAVSLFSGIGGIEYGLERSGIQSKFFCEIDPLAQAILRRRFPNASFHDDITTIKKLPQADIITAGFPCQDLSQAGGKKGLEGGRSGLVKKLLTLIEEKALGKRPPWILIENVPYMLRLDSGKAMRFVTGELSRLGYRWAYRVVDARSFGLPQRRPRVVLLASLEEQPQDVLFDNNFVEPDIDGKPNNVDGASAFGFYWTEGKRGVGWAREGVPPIKCGSTLGIASPPAVWFPQKEFFGTIGLGDAERLQGFPEGWTDFSLDGIDARQSYRWRLIGNAVSTNLSTWVGQKLQGKIEKVAFEFSTLNPNGAWPDAAFGNESGLFKAKVSRWASNSEQELLSSFLKTDLKPLSQRATLGFLGRALECTNVVYSKIFLGDLKKHAEAMA
ncbi:DNA (cytosine-5-)-methyltransferase [Pseudoduganella sp. FT25W]|uniref:Cytosine-specific methyltransferase n=1 Tax=Duganella alba TaxID=2666081 RepID=A0A6L5QBC2_9BURK|nr:DNA (cytosine-5-)-methyltransferase [Duganella alba]MRX07016.1 DNA (cytosine-5-)-methyltransferase [Duganella alba]MRX16087.1 DNA (cytosine-5-)-methyltransferase [Duganella alba]